MFTFYRYDNHIGDIPAGVSFRRRQTEYSTIIVMQLLGRLSASDAMRAVAHILPMSFTGPLKPHSWYDLRTGEFYEDDFVKLTRSLQRCVAQRAP